MWLRDVLPTAGRGQGFRSERDLDRTPRRLAGERAAHQTFIEVRRDAANPWADFPIGLAIHFIINVVLGTVNGMGGALY